MVLSQGRHSRDWPSSQQGIRDDTAGRIPEVCREGFSLMALHGNSSQYNAYFTGPYQIT